MEPNIGSILQMTRLRLGGVRLSPRGHIMAGGGSGQWTLAPKLELRDIRSRDPSVPLVSLPLGLSGADLDLGPQLQHSTDYSVIRGLLVLGHPHSRELWS